MITWWRAGATALRWTSGRTQARHTKSGKISIRFSVPAAGGGETVIQIIIDPEDYDHVRKLMGPSKRELELYRQIGELTVERDAWKSQLLNESVRPDRVAEFREKVMANVIQAVQKA